MDLGALQFHNALVSAQSATGAVLAPNLVTDFEEHGTGQGFGSHGVQLQANTLTGFELIFTLVTGAGTAVLVGTEIGMLTIVKRHDPLALGLEVDSVGTGDHAIIIAAARAGHKLLHDNTFLHYFRIFRSHPLRDLFPLRDPTPDLWARIIRPELKARF